MKSRRLTYLLFPLVAAIWGYAIYKYFFEPYGSQHSPQATTRPTPIPEAATLATPDTFSLLENYPDPFLLGKPEPPRVQPPSPPQHEPKPQAPGPKPQAQQPPPLDWTAYKYNGLIQRTGTTHLVGILRIQGKAHYVHVGDQAQDALILSMDTDSIQLRRGTATKMIGRR